MNRRGFTLIELMIALVLTGIVTAAIYQLLVTNQRVYRQQTERVDLNQNVRAAVGILPTELRELNAADTVESDLLVLGDSALTYKGMRTFMALCQPPSTTPGVLLAWPNTVMGIRDVDPARDSVLVFAEKDEFTLYDNYWVHANVAGSVTLGTGCPGSTPSVAIPVDNVYPPGGLNDVHAGAPVRTFEMMQALAYADVNGDWWLGARNYVKGSGWTGIQPVLGPLAAAGLQFAYYDRAGDPTAVPDSVARIGVTVVGRTSDPVSRGGGTQTYVLDTLVTDIALRSIPR